MRTQARGALAWQVLEGLLLGTAMVLAVGAAVSGFTGGADRTSAALVAFVAAGLAGVSVVLDIPGRARRAAAAAPAPSPVSGNGQHRCPAHGGGAVRAGERHRHRLRWAFWLAIGFLGVEAGAAVATGSLALLSDAGHVLADSVGLGMALAAIRLASTGSRNPSRTFGLYRLEIVAALANATLLIGVATYVFVEAAIRLNDPPEVPGEAMLVVAVAGLAANLASLWLLRPGARESLNVRGAYLEVTADAIGSVGLLVAGLAIRLTGWVWIDPVAGAAIGLWILPRAFNLGREAVRVLVQAAPPEVDVAALEADLRAVDGVVDVHQLHLWTLTSEMEVASAHLRVNHGVDSHRVLNEARVVLQDRYHVEHVTLQVEADQNSGCRLTNW